MSAPATDELWRDPHTDEVPDGWIIKHARATDQLIFGPFATLAEAKQFAEANPLVQAYAIPIYKTVNWNRRG